ncbi:uncharacterized protein LOC129596989 isoform X2 [Paramacrobiotus metropolitanus]|uniref:uncharacterized protein LOC129596989 isoform X2 n=1 Tax=Paramacrobiotus metropolitanus TaxID=2943436 RepID=UPI0024464AE4|nr:uncharacterized protein LOC129596989 isoform X2 [Paramacrobiotus metropolitanus]
MSSLLKNKTRHVHTSGVILNDNLTTDECNWKRALRMNVTDDTRESASASLVYLTTFPVLLFLCTVGSVLTVAVLLNDRSQRKTSTAVYMVGAALGNLCIMWPLFPDYCFFLSGAISYGVPYDIDKAPYTRAFYRALGLLDFLSYTAADFVDWTLIIFATERLFSAIRPLLFFSRRKSSAWKRAVIKEVIILILAGAFSLSYLWIYYYYWTSPKYSSQDEMLLQIPSLKHWYILQSNADVHIPVYSVPRETIMLIAKRLLLLLIDGVLIFVLWRHKRSVKRTLSRRTSSSTQNANHIVLGSLVLYLITQLPTLGYQFALIASRPPYCRLVLTNGEDSSANDIVQIISWVDYSVTFWVYYASSLKFRQQCADLYRRFCKSSRVFCCKHTHERSTDDSSTGRIILSAVTSSEVTRNRTTI